MQIVRSFEYSPGEADHKATLQHSSQHYWECTTQLWGRDCVCSPGQACVVQVDRGSAKVGSSENGEQEAIAG